MINNNKKVIIMKKTGMILFIFLSTPAFSQTVEDMVRDYDKKNNITKKLEDRHTYVTSDDFEIGEIKIKQSDILNDNFGDNLKKVDELVKSAKFKSIYYQAESIYNFVGYDSQNNIGKLRVEDSDFILKDQVYDFGVKIAGTKCISFFNVKNNKENIEELKKIKSYRISGVTDYLFVENDKYVNGGNFAGFYNNISCSFFNTFKEMPNVSSSISFEYKPQFIEVER